MVLNLMNKIFSLLKYTVVNFMFQNAVCFFTLFDTSIYKNNYSKETFSKHFHIKKMHKRATNKMAPVNKSIVFRYVFLLRYFLHFASNKWIVQHGFKFCERRLVSVCSIVMKNKVLFSLSTWPLVKIVKISFPMVWLSCYEKECEWHPTNYVISLHKTRKI